MNTYFIICRNDTWLIPGVEGTFPSLQAAQERMEVIKDAYLQVGSSIRILYEVLVTEDPGYATHQEWVPVEIYHGQKLGPAEHIMLLPEGDF